MSEIQLKATNVENKPVRIGDLPIIKTNILENAGQMDKGVVGGYNGAFPLTAASEGGIYLLPSTGKFYVCETAYNGSQLSAPNSNFVELSVWKNHDRLNNLIHFGKTLSAEDDLNKIMLDVKPIITIFTVSKDIPKNAPSGAGTYGLVITMNFHRAVQIYIDSNFVKTRMVASSNITNWV